MVIRNRKILRSFIMDTPTPQKQSYVSEHSYNWEEELVFIVFLLWCAFILYARYTIRRDARKRR